MKTKWVIINSVIAACYVILTMIFASVSFGLIQIRIATSIYQLVAYNKKYYWGCVMGVVIADLIASPLGFLDVFAGLGVTGLGLGISIVLNKKISSINVRSFIVGTCVCLCMIFVAIELHNIFNFPLFITYLYLIIGQIISQLFGFVLFKLLSKRISI